MKGDLMVGGEGARAVQVLARRNAISILVIASALLAPAASATAASPLPEGRVFERVSPADTDGNPAVQSVGGFVEPLDADTVVFGGGTNPIAESPSGINPVYLAKRIPGIGWQTSSLLPPGVTPAQSYAFLDSTPDLSASVWQVRSSYVASAPPPSVKPIPILRYRDAAGAYETIVTDESAKSLEDPSGYAGMSQDGSRIVYSSHISPASLPDTGELRKVYRWSPGGQVERLASGAGSPLAKCNTDVSGVADGFFESVRSRTTNNVSADGSVVFLQSNPTPGVEGCPETTQVYVTDGEAATLVSQEPKAEPGKVKAGQEPAYFVGAAPDGRVAYLETKAALTEEDEDPSPRPDLYRWEAPAAGAPAGGSLTCLTCDHTVTEGDQFFEKNAVLSSTGEYLYFETVLNQPTYHAPLFVYHDGVTREVVGTEETANIPVEATMNRAGNVIVFARRPSTINEFPLYRAVVTATRIEVEPLALDASGGTARGGIQGLHGQALERFISPPSAAGVVGGLKGAISDDGNTIVFESPLALTPEAVEYGIEEAKVSNRLTNVYSWHDGKVSLIDAAAETVGGAAISADGQSIFLDSSETLTPDTTQRAGTIYAARVDGGFPVPAAPSPCVDEVCQGPTSRPPANPPATTRGPSGGNPVLRRLSLARPTKAALNRAASSGVLTLELVVRGPGRVVAKALMAGNGKRRVVAHAGAEVGADTKKLELRLRLARAAMVRLRSAGRLHLTAVVKLPGTSARRIGIVLRGARS